MRLFKARGAKGDGFRLSSEAFYFKFVRRQESSASTNVLLPLGHFEVILEDPKARTKAGNLRVSYSALDGRYMRQMAFVDLLRAGYIGSDASTTEHLQTLINKVVSGDNSVVIAVQRETRKQEHDQDRRRKLRQWQVDDQVE